jgi:hypothetical protein
VKTWVVRAFVLCNYQRFSRRNPPNS